MEKYNQLERWAGTKLCKTLDVQKGVWTKDCIVRAVEHCYELLAEQ